MKRPFFVGPMIISLLISCGKKEEYIVRRIDLVQAVYASGEVLPVDFHEVTSKMPGVVDSIYVSVGQIVQPGEPLLKIQAEVNQLNFNTARDLYELARRNASKDSEHLASLRQRVNAAYATYRQDSLDYERNKRLHAQQIGTDQTFEQSRLRFETSASNYSIARSNYRQTNDQLQTELKSARNNYLAQQSMLGDYMIVADSRGKIFDILPEAGELVNSNRPIIDMGSADSFEVEMLVDETDIMLINKGQEVVYKLDAVADTVFRGTVKEIYPRINSTDKTARVVADIDPVTYDLYPGMTLEANIVIRKKKDILAVPVEYVSMDGTVAVKRKSKTEIVKVRIGIRDLTYAEIISGLNENDHILKP